MIDVKLDKENGCVTIDNGMQYLELDSAQAREVAQQIIDKLTKHNIQEERKNYGFEGGKL